MIYKMFAWRKIFKGDKIIWLVLMFLSLISMLVVYSATGKLAYREAGGQTAYYLMRQFGFIVGGFGLMAFMVNVIPVKLYSWIAPLVLLLSVIALLGALEQYRMNPSRMTPRSLDLAVFSFQPAELAKIAMVMFTARVLSRRQKTKEELKTAFYRIVIAASIVCGIIFFGNASTAILIFACVMLMMLIGRIPEKYLVLTVVAGASLMALIYFTADYLPDWVGRVHTVKDRIDDFIFGDDELEIGTTQADYARLAIYEGGPLGKGPGGSDVSNYMEAAYNDFIYSIIIEEFGWSGSFAVPFLFLVLLYRGGVIVSRSDRTFPAFLAAGMVLMIVLQAFTNMAVSVGVIPVTGQPLPWVSVGGTSMAFTACSFGIILSVSCYNRKNKATDGQPVQVDLPDEDAEMKQSMVSKKNSRGE